MSERLFPAMLVVTILASCLVACRSQHETPIPTQTPGASTADDVDASSSKQSRDHVEAEPAFTLAEAVNALRKSNATLIANEDDEVTSVQLGPDSPTNALRYLVALPKLQSVTLRGMSLPTDDIAPLARLTTLKALVFEDTPIDDMGIDHLLGLQQLEYLDLTGRGITDEGATKLNKLVQLEFLFLKATSVSLLSVGRFKYDREELVLRIHPMPDDEKPVVDWFSQKGAEVGFNEHGKVRLVDLASIKKVTDADIFQLRWFSHLEVLDLRGTAATDESVETLCRLKKLTSLDVGSTSISEEKVAELIKALPHLWSVATGIGAVPNIRRSFSDLEAEDADSLRSSLKQRIPMRESLLIDSDATAEDIASARSVSRLTQLYVVDANLSEDVLREIEKLLYLRSLYIRGKKLTADHISNQLAFWNLDSLQLIDVGLTDDAVIALSNLRHLEKLSIVANEITGTNLGTLQENESLRELVLTQTNVNDEAIDQLSQLQQLKSLYLFDTKMTEDGVKRLMQALPNCRIYH